MANEQFKWRGNTTGHGYPVIPTDTWPEARAFAAMWSCKNLLWLYGGDRSQPGKTTYYTDLSTFSDGTFLLCLIFYTYFKYFCIILFSHISSDSMLCSSMGISVVVDNAKVCALTASVWAFSVDITLPTSEILTGV